MDNDLKHNLKNQSTWGRGLYMLLFCFLAGIADLVLFGVVLFQFVHKLITGKTNERLLLLGQGLARYIFQVIQFLTFNSEYHPYPFGAWPESSAQVNEGREIEKKE